MQRHRIWMLWMCLGLAPLATCNAADADIDARLDALFGAHAPLQEFLATLKSEAAAKDWAAIGARVAYPLRVSLAGRRVRIRNAVEFAAHSQQILTPKVLAAIQAQTYAGLFANAQGVMIGNGEVWFTGVCPDTRCSDAPVRITAFNP
jgi:hypothetical protein